MPPPPFHQIGKFSEQLAVVAYYPIDTNFVLVWNGDGLFLPSTLQNSFLLAFDPLTYCTSRLPYEYCNLLLLYTYFILDEYWNYMLFRYITSGRNVFRTSLVMHGHCYAVFYIATLHSAPRIRYLGSTPLRYAVHHIHMASHKATPHIYISTAAK